MNIWGERFAEVGQFIGYCRDLNVEVREDELEHYERVGAMLPVARVVYPDDYVIQKNKRRHSIDTSWIAQWPALTRLSERIGPFPYGYVGLTNEELVHCFDREMEAENNPYLVRPDSSLFHPWSDYRVRVHDSQRNEVRLHTAKHYYSYWQVHQLYFIQQYPDLYRNAALIQSIPEDNRRKMLLPRAPRNDLFVEFDGMRRNFDALSFWTTVYSRERSRTFANIAEINGVRRLDDVQAADYRRRLIDLAKNIIDRFQITPDSLYEFLRRLIDLFENYERNERRKLAEEVKKDIFAWTELLMLTTGKTWDEVGEGISKANIYDKRTFRHLDIATKERDYAHDFLQQFRDAQLPFSETDVDDLLDYCEQTGLGLFITALSGMVAVGDEEYRHNFRRVQKYTNLKNVLTACEYLLKNLAQGSGRVTGGETLTALIHTIMCNEPWYKTFRDKNQEIPFSGNNSQDFLDNLSALYGDDKLEESQEGYWAQKFLILCLARNMTVHSYPSEDSFYGDLFGPMLDAAITATFYTWRLAKTRGWV